MKSFFIHQKITAFANQYKVFTANGDQAGDLTAFAHQKRLALKEKIMFYTSEDKQEIAFQLQAQNIMEFAGVYDVTDAHGKVLGTLRKQFKASLLRSTWHLCLPGEQQPFLIVRERSPGIAIIRRLWGFLPFVGEFPFPFKFHFDFVDPTNETVIKANYEKITLIRDHYKLSVEDDLLSTIDVRVFLAQGVALDALQSR